MTRASEQPCETALVTGASAGIGRALALEFAKRGFDLVLVARRQTELGELAERCRTAHGVQVTVLPTDLLVDDAPARLQAALDERGIAIDVLVNNAGQLENGRFAEIEPEKYTRLLQLNVAALTGLTRQFVGPMLRRGRGRILNVASTAGFQPVPSLAVYAATKAYVLSLSEALAEELRDSGVSVTALCPGITRTVMFDQVREKNTLAREMPEFLLSDVADVAAEGVAGCIDGKVIVVPGRLNQNLAALVQLYPRWLPRRVLGWIARRSA
jgi:short-subunit dehydrogenase